MSYEGRHGRGVNRKRDAMPRRWERKQSERQDARDEAKRLAEERLGREPDPSEETAPFTPASHVADDEAAFVGGPPAGKRSHGRARKEPSGARAATSGRDSSGDAGGVPVGRVLEAAVIALALASLLLGHRIHADAEQMPLGPVRTVAVIASTPPAWLNGLLRIDSGWQAMRSWASGFMDPEAVPDGGDAPEVSAEPTVAPAVSSPATTAPAPDEPAEPDGAVTGAWVAPRTPSNSAPLDLYFCGDSLSMDVGASFLNVSVKTGAIETKRFWRNATGLSRPDAYDWPAELRLEMSTTPHEAVVAMFGANDGQSVEHEGEVLQLYTPEWEALYAERVGEAMDILASGGARVYWVGLPIPRSEKQAKKYTMMNGIYQAEAAKRPSVLYIDSWKLFSDASGKYAELLKDDRGKLVDMRKDDGIHFTIAGANRMAEKVLGIICDEWGIPEP